MHLKLDFYSTAKLENKGSFNKTQRRLIRTTILLLIFQVNPFLFIKLINKKDYHIHV